MLTQTGCLERQRRLRQALAERRIDAAVISDPSEIYYFAGVLPRDLPFRVPSLLWIDAQTTWLIAPTGTADAFVDDMITYDWSVGSTSNADWLRVLNTMLVLRLGASVSRLGYQVESLPHLLGATIDAKLHPDDWIALDDLIGMMQRSKDADEIDLIRRSIQCDLAAYAAAQQVLQPGVREIDVLAAAQQGANWAAGEQVYHTGDYRAGATGGAARDRQCEAGEMYIIDAWTQYRGYWSDLSRTFMVGGEPTDLQQSVFEHLKSIHDQVPSLLKPGLWGVVVWGMIDSLVRQHPALADSGLTHHAGHGLGLRAHEMPDLNPDRGGELEVGTVVSVEPGAYLEAEGVFVRLENMYLITPNGAENLSVLPMSLR